MLDKSEFIKTRVYSFRELCTILMECDNLNDFNRLTCYVRKNVKKYSLADLKLLKTLVESRLNDIKTT